MVYKLLFFIFVVTISLNSVELKDINTYKANFLQTITKNDDTKITYEGLLFIKKPAHILWQYKKPIVKNVFINDYMVVVDEPELEQAIFSQLREDLNFIDILEKAKKISENKFLALIDNKEYNLIIENGILKKIDYIDEVENKVEILFNDIDINTDIDNSLFRFEIPSDYDIIRK